MGTEEYFSKKEGSLSITAVTGARLQQQNWGRVWVDGDRAPYNGDAGPALKKVQLLGSLH